MTDDNKYNIISVNTDDDDEIVIEAGARKAKPSRQPAREAVSEDDVSASEPAVESEQPPVPAPVPAEPRTSEPEQPVEADDYRPTTLEDLKEDGPMGRTRMIILGLALLVLVGFLIYYNFLR